MTEIFTILKVCRSYGRTVVETWTMMFRHFVSLWKFRELEIFLTTFAILISSVSENLIIAKMRFGDDTVIFVERYC